MARHIKRHWSGFTIVELLIVIVVIGILAAISVVAYIGIRGQAQTAAHKQDVSQAERQILAYAALAGEDANGVAGALIGYQEGIGTRTLLRPLTGTPDITMYTVCSVIATTASYTAIAGLTPTTFSEQVFQFQNSGSGGVSMGYRIDTSAQPNASANRSTVRVPGNTIVGWLQVSNNLTVRSVGWNQAASHDTATLSPGLPWNFTGVDAKNNSGGCTPQLTLVFNTAHDQTTRASVVGWLAEKYHISL